MDHCHKDIQRLNSNNSEEVVHDNEHIDFEEKKRRHNKKRGLKHNDEIEELEENPNDFYYFYQSSTGENLYLHPIC